MNKIRAYTFNSTALLLLLSVALFEQRETFFSAILNGSQTCTPYICKQKLEFLLTFSLDLSEWENTEFDEEEEKKVRT